MQTTNQKNQLFSSRTRKKVYWTSFSFVGDITDCISAGVKLRPVLPKNMKTEYTKKRWSKLYSRADWLKIYIQWDC